MKTTLRDYVLSIAALAICLGFATVAATFAAPFLSAHLGDYHVIAGVTVFALAFGLACGVLTRIVIAVSPLDPGTYAMDHTVFARWKFLIVVHHFGHAALLPFSMMPLRPAIAALFGARLGRNVAYAGVVADLSLVVIGDNVVLGHNSVLTPHAISSGQITLAPIRIGNGVTIGVHAVIMAGVQVGENSVVTAGAVVPPHTQIPPNEMWGGMPARKIKDLSPADVRG